MDGTNEDPMSPISGTAAQIGVMAPSSVATISDRCFWLGASNAGRYMVQMGSGLGAPRRVSDNALEEQISNLEHPSSAVGSCYMDRGHLFYVLTFTVDQVTFVFDADTGAWHVRSSINADTARNAAYAPSYFAEAYDGGIISASVTSQKLYTISSSLKTYDESPVVRNLITPVMWAEANPMILKEFLVDVTLGTTEYENGEESANPMMVGKFSGDGGNSWSHGTQKSLGRTGQYGITPPKFLNAAYGRGILAWLSCSGDVAFTIRLMRATLSPTNKR